MLLRVRTRSASKGRVEGTSGVWAEVLARDLADYLTDVLVDVLTGYLESVSLLRFSRRSHVSWDHPDREPQRPRDGRGPYDAAGLPATPMDRFDEGSPPPARRRRRRVGLLWLAEEHRT